MKVTNVEKKENEHRGGDHRGREGQEFADAVLDKAYLQEPRPYQ